MGVGAEETGHAQLKSQGSEGVGCKGHAEQGARQDTGCRAEGKDSV